MFQLKDIVDIFVSALRICGYFCFSLKNLWLFLFQLKEFVDQNTGRLLDEAWAWVQEMMQIRGQITAA